MTRPRRSRIAPIDMRTSVHDRDAVISLLNEAFALGRLEPPEFETRVGHAMRTGTYRELYRALDGLPVERRRLPQPPRTSRGARRVPVTLVAVLLLVGAGTVGWLAGRPADPAPGALAATTPSLSTAPAQTATPDPAPERSPADEADAVDWDPGTTADPTVAPVTRSGSGTSIVTVPWAAGVMPMIEFQVDRPRWTTFSLSDADGFPFFTDFGADGGGGRTTGTTVMERYSTSGEGTLRLKVETEGAWTLTLRDVDDAPQLQRSGEGSGYEVFWYDGPEAVFSFEAGAGLYTVSSDYDFHMVGVGPEHNEGVIPAGRRLVQIEADGPWRYAIN